MVSVTIKEARLVAKMFSDKFKEFFQSLHFVLYMDPLSDFMASSHLSESGPTIASPQLVGSFLPSNMTSKIGLPYHSEAVRVLVDLRGLIVT